MAEVQIIEKVNGRIDRNKGTIINGPIKVAAYARVSTEKEEQINSYNFQLKYYEEKIKSWKYLTRDEQADYLMKWIKDILLTYDDKKIKVKKINFRNSFFDDLCNLFANGYLDMNRIYVDEKNEKVKMRYSEYLPTETITENLLRLREFYNVGYYESVYNYDNKTMEFEYVDGRQIVRCFPVDEEKSKIGFLYIDKNEITKFTKPEEVFEYIPCKEKENHYVMKSITIKG